jgi:methionyl-tRNA formyltransferase
MQMRLVFMGTPEFAVPSLEKLAENHEVCGVITAPDKPAGRGKKLTSSAVKQAAESLGIKILQPTNLKDPTFQSELASLNADLFGVVAFRMLPEAVWSMPSKGTINLHASLLPNYRGAAPINRAIMDGQTETGLTTFFIEKDIDTGNIIEQVRLSIGPDEDAGSLHDRMMQAGASLLLSTVNQIEAGNTNPVSQEDALKSIGEVRSAPKIFREDCEINWNLSSVDIHNHIRGLSPYPAAWTRVFEQAEERDPFKVLAAVPSAIHKDAAPGAIHIEGTQMMVKTGNGWLELLSVQPAGKKRMSAADFLRGKRISEELTFAVHEK